MKPFYKNSCSGYYSKDWLEVMLTPKCQAKCIWCVERSGFHPDHVASWRDIVNKALQTEAKNIILLGGEPTLYTPLKEIVSTLSAEKRNVYLTTNGALLTPDFVNTNLKGLYGVNISIHSDSKEENDKIVGLKIHYDKLFAAIQALKAQGTRVRFNCNLIHGYIDSASRIKQYVVSAKMMGADTVRFAELKTDTGEFVSLDPILEYFTGQTFGDPYTTGCSHDIEICGVECSFRRMCGLQTPFRKRPDAEQQVKNQVLYYDANLYQGWQRKDNMTNREQLKNKIKGIIARTQAGTTHPDDAVDVIMASVYENLSRRVDRLEDEIKSKATAGDGCVY